MRYNWQLPDWPTFHYDLSAVESALFSLTEKLGRVDGILSSLSAATQQETLLDIMVSEAVKTSEIEGEFLSRKDVMSSIKNQLGLNPQPERVTDKRAEGAAQLMVAVREQFREPLTERMLFDWHTMLMKGSQGINAGIWRTHTAPMQVVSGPLDRQKVHFEAPPSSQVPEEMRQFISWFNETSVAGTQAIKSIAVRSAIAHVYFESIHPFEDGNGRIGRAISEKAFSQHLGRPVLLSLSQTINADRNAYYTALQIAQRTNDLTEWLHYFIHLVLAAQAQAETLIHFSLKKTQFFDRYQGQFNDRQLRVLRRMLAEGPKGFEGGMRPKKYMGIAKTSKATATRDLQDLVKKGAMRSFGAGRSTRYEVEV